MNTSDIDSARIAALTNLRNAIDPKARLPNSVFRGSWGVYRFFESDNMFHDNYVTAVTFLLEAESAVTACVVNLDRPEPNLEDGAAYFLERDSDPETYRRKMRGVDVGYVGRDRFGSASDVGSWCAYCENDGDIGVIAIRDARLAEAFEPALRLIWAKPFRVISNGDDPSAVYPFTNLLPEWREGLASNFQ